MFEDRAGCRGDRSGAIRAQESPQWDARGRGEEMAIIVDWKKSHTDTMVTPWLLSDSTSWTILGLVIADVGC